MATEELQDSNQITDDTLAGMSDEQIADLDPAVFSSMDGGTNAPAQEEEEWDDGETTDAGDGDNADADDNADAETGADADAEPADDDDPDSAAGGGTDDPEGESAEGEEPSGDDDPEADKPEGEEGADKTAEIDYKAEYERLFAPFKANGKEIKIDSVDDAISLMQMGANYNKKMATLKPNLKVMKLLENNDLLSEEKLNYLVDLSKKNPDAIRKLVKDSGVDPLEMDTDSDSDYTPSDYSVDDREIELDSVLDEIQDTPTYQKTIQLVKDQWDAESKRTVSESPQLLKVVNDHMQSGVYDIISTELEKERMLGRLNGLSDLEAYKQVGDAIQERGGFDHLSGSTQSRQEAPASQAKPEPKKVKPAPKQKVADPKVKSKKRAASSTRTAPAASKADAINPLAMSDADFDKLVNEKLL